MKNQSPGQNSEAALNAAYNEGVKFYQAGKFPEAEKIFRQILSINPRHAHTLHMMGRIGFYVQKYDIAEELVHKALAENKTVPSFYLTLANVLGKKGKHEEAVTNYKKALAIDPDFLDALNNLGTTLITLKKFDEAAEIFKRILRKNPKHFNAICNTASLLFNDKKYEEALELFHQALIINPKSAAVHYDIGRALKALNKTDEALTSFKQAVEYKPDHGEALLSIGHVFHEKGKFDEALDYLNRSASMRPDAEVYARIADIHLKSGRYFEALNENKRALELMPHSPDILNNLGTLYNTMGQFEEALDFFEKALVFRPDNKEIFTNIGAPLKSLGRLSEAIDFQKRAVALDPQNGWIYSNLLLTMVYSASVSAEELVEASRKFGQVIADPLSRTKPFSNDKNPERKLRVGYISPDFRNHAVSYFLAPIRKHDRENFELFAYSNTIVEDSITEKLKKDFDFWRDIRFLSEEESTALIESDQIDILVDVAGHTAGNSLKVFARKPAPIQVTWLGHPATTGMKAMDYRLTDSYAEPPGMTEHLNTETLWRMPEMFCVYKPHENSPAVIDHPPFEDNGHITFGCFNNFSKVTDPVLKLWAKIMEQVPDSRLLLEIAGIDSEKIRGQIEERLKNIGLPMDRVKLEPRRRANQFVLYNKIDIALDPFPCCGGTTSTDTLWMGVPFVTLAGRHFLSRMGVTVLSNAGLPELIAQTPEEYVAIAVDLAKDKDKLRKLRHGLREKVAASPVMNQENFAKNLDAAFREMWRIYCAT